MALMPIRPLMASFTRFLHFRSDLWYIYRCADVFQVGISHQDGSGRRGGGSMTSSTPAANHSAATAGNSAIIINAKSIKSKKWIKSRWLGSLPVWHRKFNPPPKPEMKKKPGSNPPKLTLHQYERKWQVRSEWLQFRPEGNATDTSGKFNRQTNKQTEIQLHLGIISCAVIIV